MCSLFGISGQACGQCTLCLLIAHTPVLSLRVATQAPARVALRQRPAAAEAAASTREAKPKNRYALARQEVIKPIRLKRKPQTLDDVQRLVTANVAHIHVHERPWAIRVYVQGLSKWRLRCDSCHHASCKWSGVALLSSSPSLLHVYQQQGFNYTRCTEASCYNRKATTRGCPQQYH